MQPSTARYRSFNQFLRQRFGHKVYRVTVDAGFTCPNVDGTVTTGGCVYCDNRSFSPNRRLPRATIRAQVERGIEILGRRYAVNHFLAYFQAATNTHAPVARPAPPLRRGPRPSPGRRTGGRHPARLRAGPRPRLARRVRPGARTSAWSWGCRPATTGRWIG